MTVQTLIPTMDQTDHSVLDRMNIQTDAIVVNQCKDFSQEEFLYRNRIVRFYNLPERGIGLSRNFSLMHAFGDIVLFADDDITFYPGYEAKVLEAFESIPDADIIAFNLDFVGAVRKRKKITRIQRVKRYNCGSYGAARIAVKLDCVRKHRLCFSLLFGGGAEYSAGEDVLFVRDALQAGLHMYTFPMTIGKIDDSKSSWFQGYSEKFFFDKGVLFAAINPWCSWLRVVRFLLRYPNVYKHEVGFRKAYRLMMAGTKQYWK